MVEGRVAVVVEYRRAVVVVKRGAEIVKAALVVEERGAVVVNAELEGLLQRSVVQY